MIATYRLQLTPEFRFDDVRALLPYFKQLGVSHLYLSPITEAACGSTHGYDVADHNSVREAFGGREAFERLREAAVNADLGIILDFVPNHASVDARNRYWQNVLAHGQDSQSAHFFDIDWQPPQKELAGKVLLPFLGKSLEQALTDAEISVAEEDGRHSVAYFDHRFALDPKTYDPTLSLTALLDRQHWRLAHYEDADRVNYRRFFNINGLIGLRQEDERVFNDTHRLLFELMAEEGVDGVRIDHVDGMADPHEYLRRLRERVTGKIWVEKILAPGETLPSEWPVEGTTGYEFMNDVMQVLVCRKNESVFDETFKRALGREQEYEEVVTASKKHVMDTLLASDLHRLACQLRTISRDAGHDFSLEDLRSALRAFVAAIGRYRTYLPHDRDEGREVLDAALNASLASSHTAERDQRRLTSADRSQRRALHFIRDTLMGETGGDAKRWIASFQQFTSPVAAKGVEDTAFYRYTRLAALNEVGGEPGDFGLSPAGFHARAGRRASQGLLATATHDHKRGEDTRMRLVALSELPGEWNDAVEALEEIAQDYQGISPAHRYLFYQTLAAIRDEADGELPGRIQDYMQKAAREGKERTSWLEPDSAYEGALEGFVRGMICDPRAGEALGSIAAEMSRLGFANTLSQTLLKCTLPGVPDFYQGTELLDLSLVDPDNRRRGDFNKRAAILEEVGAFPAADTPERGASTGRPEATRQWLADMIERQDARAKLYFITRLLWLRRTRPGLFEGGYRALETSCNRFAFMRTIDNDAPGGPEDYLLVIVPRLPGERPAKNDGSISLPRQIQTHSWRDVLTGVTIANSGRSLSLQDLPLRWAALLPRATSPPAPATGAAQR